MEFSTALMIGMVTGTFGMAYIVYGKKQQRITPFVAGILLCAYPYVIDNFWLSCVVGLALITAPFVIQY